MYDVNKTETPLPVLEFPASLEDSPYGIALRLAEERCIKAVAASNLIQVMIDLNVTPESPISIE